MFLYNLHLQKTGNITTFFFFFSGEKLFSHAGDILSSLNCIHEKTMISKFKPAHKIDRYKYIPKH